MKIMKYLILLLLTGCVTRFKNDCLESGGIYIRDIVINYCIHTNGDRLQIQEEPNDYDKIHKNVALKVYRNR